MGLQAKATHYYVDSAATAGANDGTSWANAYRNVQTAINVTPVGDTLWIARGHYYPGPSGSNNDYFDFKNGVVLLGGFSGLTGSQETSASQRNFNLHQTIFSGDLDKNGQHSAGDAYHVTSSAGHDTTAVVDGIIIEMGNAVGNGGGSIGAGIFSFGGGGTYLNCTIRNNYAADRGAGIHAIGNFIFKGCLFQNNQTPTIGGAISQSNSGVRIRIHNCSFVGNSAGVYAGAIYAEANDFQIFNTTFKDNVGNFGSCIVTTTSNMQVRNCIMWGNTPANEIAASVPIVDHCLIEGGYGPGTNILDIDPEFSDVVGRIRACSPAVDVGDSLLSITKDFDNNPRPFDGDGNGTAKWDLGAFEAQVVRSFPPSNPILGANPACAHSFNNLYRVTTDNTPLNTYLWTLGSGGTIVSGTTNDSLRVNWGTTLGTYTLTVKETNVATGCATTNTANITLNAVPSVSISPSPFDSICTGTSRIITVTGAGVSRQWYRNGAPISGATGTSFTATLAGYYNCIVTGANGCGDSASVGLKLYLRPLPIVTFTTSIPTPICQGDIVTISGSPGVAHQWYRNGAVISGATNSSYATGLAGVYNMRQTDSHGCIDSAATGLSLIVNPLPIVTLTPHDTDTICIGDSMSISAATPNAVSYQWFRNGTIILGATGNPYFASQTGFFNCRITNTNTCRDTAAVGHRVIENDFVNPVAVCHNVTVHLNGAGSASLVPAMIDNGSTDNCAIASRSLSATTRTCANLGNTNIVLTVTDFASRTSTCNSVVTTLDTIKPVANCINPTVYIGTGGSLTLNPAVVGGSSTDNCSILTQVVSPNTFACADTGSHVVTYTATDASGNFRSCTATIILEDSTRPIAICRTATIYLNGLGNASIVPGNVNNGSSDNCGIASLSVSQTAFTCADVPGRFVTLSVRDISSNIGTCQGYVRVIDSVAPIALCHDTIIYINNSGVANLLPSNLDDGSSDNCFIDSTWISQSNFSCLDTGLNVVTLSVIDADTNLRTCLSNVTILDTVAPQAVCTDTTFFLNPSGIATVNPAIFGINSFDNCTFFDTSYVDVPTFNCAQTGPHTIELFVVDVNGRIDSCTGVVTILDNLPPVMVCQNISPILNPGGTVTITASQVNNGTTDNCGVQSLAISQSSFTCANVGPNSVTLTATDVFGNSSTCVSTVTVTDTVAPVPVCQNLTLYLNGSGNASTTAAAVNNGSTDNCAIGNIALSPTAFTCANTGANPVTLTVTDTYGNARTCAATVTVIDSIRPTAVCSSSTRYLDALGQFALSATMVNNGSTDNCSISSSTVNPSSFTCANLGANSVTLTVTDPSGATRTCTATVTVMDSIRPTPVCSNGTFYLNAGGTFGLTVPDVASASTDNCAITTSSLSKSSFTCADVGTNSVTVSMSDASGNTNSCTVTVTIADSTDPVALCQNLTVYLSLAGTAGITTGQVDNGSTDACGIASRSLSQSNFSCNDVGTNSIVLSVTDNNSNVGTCTASVSVLDTIAPQIACTTANVNLDASGNYSLMGSLLTSGSTDVCSIDTAFAVPYLFNCQDIGTQTVMVYVEDPSGNRDSCSTTITLTDNLAPVADCDSIVLQLGSNGTVSMTPLQLGPNSADNCAIDSSAASRTDFTCADLGWVTVTLQLWDSTGNTSNCTGHVHIVDTTGVSAAGVNLGSDTITCNGDTLHFTAPAGMSSYTWSTGDTTQSISVTNAGLYWVSVTSPIGCDGIDSVVVSAFTMADPHLRSESGELVVCLNDTLRLLVDPGFTVYQWSTGSSTTFTDITAGGNYSVLVTDANGCVQYSTVNVNFAPFPAPNPIIVPNGTVNMCENTSMPLDAGPGYYSYLWSTGQTSQVITAFIPNTYSVQVWNGFGCHNTSDPVTVVLIPSPYPDINANGNLLYTNAVAVSYQWYLGTVPILGATSSSYTATLNGTYTVRAFYANGCDQVSNDLTFIVGVEEEMIALEGISVSPNPSDGHIQLLPASPLKKRVAIRVVDMFGRELSKSTLKGLASSYDGSQWPVGRGLSAGNLCGRCQSDASIGDRMMAQGASFPADDP
ncbi:MAG: HYR domain-containing protein [Bacteroidia bacterium]